MPQQQSRLLRLTENERKTIEMAIHGHSMQGMGEILHQSPRLMQRYLDKGLGKLEMWALEAAPVKNHRAPGELDVRPREGERMVARLIRATGESWTCLAIAAIPVNSQSPQVDTMTAEMSHVIHQNVREGDVVIKWSRISWVIFLPRTTLVEADLVMNRLQPLHHVLCESVMIGAGEPQGHEPFIDAAARCHQAVISHYVSHDLWPSFLL